MTRSTLAVSLALAAAAPAAAQQIRGTVVDSTGTAVIGETVMFHNVTSTAGSLLGQTTTDSAGGFTFEAAAGAAEGSVYFAAVRRNGQLYIGEMLRAPITATVDYRIEVGPGGRLPELGPASGPAIATTPQQQGTGDGTAWLLAIPVVAAAGFGAWLLLRPKGPPARRRTLRDIAELDEQHAAASDADAHYRARRAELFDQLRHESR